MRGRHIRTWRSGEAALNEDRPRVKTVREAVTQYLQWMAEMNYAAMTIVARKPQLLEFVEWCEDRGVSLLSEVTANFVERYPGHLHNRKHPDRGTRLGAAAQQHHLLAVKELFRWSYRKRHCATNPASELDLPRVERRLPKQVLTPARVERIMAQVDIRTPVGLRDRAILEVLYATGIRRSEAARLKINDVQTHPGTLTVRQGKGKKDRMMPIGNRALLWVDKYLTEARPLFVRERDPEALFLKADGTAATMCSLGDWIVGYIRRAGVKQGNCHLFRHAMATAMLDHGADLRFIQRMLGHSGIQSTEIYTHVSLQKLREVYEATHPGANLRPLKKKRKKPIK